MAKGKMVRELERLYESHKLPFLPTKLKAKAVLSIYRNVVWSVKNTAQCLVCEQEVTYGSDLGNALSYLENFAPDRVLDDFEARVRYLFETKWLIDIIDRALDRIREYPVYGECYHTILKCSYLSCEKYSNEDIMRKVALGKTAFYERKSEAIAIMGIALWGYALPALLKEIVDEKNEKNKEKQGQYQKELNERMTGRQRTEIGVMAE